MGAVLPGQRALLIVTASTAVASATYACYLHSCVQLVVQVHFPLSSIPSLCVIGDNWSLVTHTQLLLYLDINSQALCVPQMVYADTQIPPITLLRHVLYWTQHALPLVFATVVSAAKTVRKVLPLSPRETPSGTS
jgi:hypothetical protein